VADGGGDGIFSQRRSIEVAHVLQSGESYKAVVGTSAPLIAGGNITPVIGVSIVGYRSEAL
jgi:hypothetical protein